MRHFCSLVLSKLKQANKCFDGDVNYKISLIFTIMLDGVSSQCMMGFKPKNIYIYIFSRSQDSQISLNNYEIKVPLTSHCSMC